MRKVNFDSPPVGDLKEVMCFHCSQKGHLKRSYPKCLQEVGEAKGKVVTPSAGDGNVGLCDVRDVGSGGKHIEQYIVL